VNIAEHVEYIASNSKDIELTKSKVVRIILHEFFKSQKGKEFEKVRELAIKMNKRAIVNSLWENTRIFRGVTS